MKKRALDAYQQEMEKYQQALESYNQLVDKIQNTHASVMKSFRGKNTVYTEGFVGLVAFAYSGYVRCEFGNTWLWLIE